MAYNKRGVPSRFRHVWGYKGVWDETKIRPRLWRFRFRASKGKKSKSYGNFGKGTTGAWKINGIQYIKKTGKGKYQTDFKGYKRPLYFKVKKPYKGKHRKWYV